MDNRVTNIAESDYKDRIIECLNDRFTERIPLAYVHSFGCQQNVSDGEKVKGLLSELGFGFSPSQDDADIVIYNTCAVRENAEAKVYGNIGELKHLKAKNPEMVICICGCMAQQQHVVDNIKKTYPQVDIVFGTYAIYDFYKMLHFVLTKKKRVFNISDENTQIAEDIKNYREDKVKAFVPIMTGCNNFCTYCIVPYVRGRERSRTIESIVAEVSDLVNSGYKEIMLLGQNVNSFKYGFSKLLREVNSIPGDFRIRFMSSHPKDATKELIDTILECDKVCTCMHLPVQAGSNRILELMNRRYSVEKYLEIIDYARSKKEDFSFTTDIIVGFPSETYDEFCETKELLTRVKYDALYTFVYSKRTGTKAAEFEDKIPTSDKGHWLREMILFQREIAGANYKRFLGKTIRVLCDGEGKSNDGLLTGKSEESIIVEFNGTTDLIGQFVDVKINKTMSWALFGEVVE